jgi:Ran-binding protein 9/10
VDKALKHTNAFYPNVLKDNEHIYFRLRSRKFIEMIREGAEIRYSNIVSPKKSNGHGGGDWYEDVINHDMEMDDLSANNSWDKMDTEGTNNSLANYDKILFETIAYGRTLQAEFKDDPRREVHKSLEDAFALFAYEDPLNAKEVSHLLKREGRVAVAEELNSAILGVCAPSVPTFVMLPTDPAACLLEDILTGSKSPWESLPAPPWNVSSNRPPFCSTTSGRPAGRQLLSTSTTI